MKLNKHCPHHCARQVVDILEQCPRSEHAWPFGLVMKGPVPVGRDFLRFAKFGTLQYSVVKPFAAFVALMLAPFGLYNEVRSTGRGVHYVAFPWSVCVRTVEWRRVAAHRWQAVVVCLCRPLWSSVLHCDV